MPFKSLYRGVLHYTFLVAFALKYSASLRSFVARKLKSIFYNFSGQLFVLPKTVRVKTEGFLAKCIRVTLAHHAHFIVTYESRELLLTVLRRLVKTKRFSNCPELGLNACFICLKLGYFYSARKRANQLLISFPDAFEVHEQVAIRFFVDAYYSQAEVIWNKSRDYKDRKLQALYPHCDTRILDRSWLMAIGHIAHLDTYIKNKILCGREADKTVLEISDMSGVPNCELLQIWKEYVHISGPGVTGSFSAEQRELVSDHFWSLKSKQGSYKMFSHAGAQVQAEWSSRGLSSLGRLPDSLDRQGYEALKNFGFSRDNWFVALHVREPGFHSKWHKSHPGTRNANIETYSKAIDLILKAGGWVIRLGDPSMKRLHEQERVIDYAHSSIKSEAIDVFLCARAKFFIGTNSGLGLVPPIFGVRCALTNWSPIGLPQWYPEDIFLPKQIRNRSNGKLLTLTEQFSTPVGWQQFDRYFFNNGLDVEDNHEDELVAVVNELLQEVIYGRKQSEGDQTLVNAYSKLALKFGSYNGSRPARVFLEKHKSELLSFMHSDV